MIHIGRHWFDPSSINHIISEAKESQYRFPVAVRREVSTMQGLNNIEETQLVSFILSEAGHRGGNSRKRKPPITQPQPKDHRNEYESCQWYRDCRNNSSLCGDPECPCNQ